MPRNIDTRLNNLQLRRSGLDRLTKIEAAAQNRIVQDSALLESWQQRASGQPNTRYALGSMQAVERRYTEIGIETAIRVGKQLETGLTGYGISVTFKLQGSVPLDVHIRGVSDVDLLTLDQSFLTYASYGSRAGAYGSTNKTSLGVLGDLRRYSESILMGKYPAATVDCSGGKAISLSGGSLARPVDVVPAHWFDNVEYQTSQQDHDRGVTIYNKKVPTTIDNSPFLHIKRVHDRDILIGGGLKKVIRLCKNVKNDAQNEGTEVNLPSFDIAALLYHANQNALMAGQVYELAILQEAQRFFDWCHRNMEQAKLFKTPDGSRIVLDNADKVRAVTALSIELDDLAREVAKEQSSALRYITPTWDQVDDTLRKSYIS